jgi:hypothetical protein
MELLAGVHPSVIFLHLVEQPWFEPDRPGLLEWVRAGGGDRIAAWFAEAVPPDQPLDMCRRRILKRWRQSRLGRRVAESAGFPDPQRRETARRAVAGLVRRITRTDESDEPRRGR